MVAMGLIGLAAAIFLAVASASRGRAQTINCASNLQQLCHASLMYMQDNDGKMPAARPYGAFAADVEMFPAPALYPYVKNYQVFRCPNAAEREEPPEYDPYPGEDSRPDGWNRESQNWFQVDYVFNTATRSDDPPNTILVGDSEPDRHGRRTWNGARLDGAVLQLPAAEWEFYWAVRPEEMMGDGLPPCCP